MFQVRHLPGGLPVVLDHGLQLASFTACLGVPLSARHEAAGEPGISHLLEHLVMSAPVAGDGPALSDWVSSVGGQANALTSKESVIYWLRVPPDHTAEAVHRLAQAVVRPVFAPDLLVQERRVVLQELAGAAADPSDAATERFFARLFDNHPLGLPVGGPADPASFPEFDVDQVLRRQQVSLATVSPCLTLVATPHLLRTALAAAGDSPLADIRPERARPSTPVPPHSPVCDLRVDAHAEYACAVLGGRGVSRRDRLWAGFEILATAVGGLPGSLLYNRLRSELGASYLLHSSSKNLSDTGVWRVLAGCHPGDLDAVSDVTRECLDLVATGRLAPQTLEAARRQALGALIIDNEDPVVRALEDSYWALDDLTEESPIVRGETLLTKADAEDVAAAATAVLASYTEVAAC